MMKKTNKMAGCSRRFRRSKLLRRADERGWSGRRDKQFRRVLPYLSPGELDLETQVDLFNNRIIETKRQQRLLGFCADTTAPPLVISLKEFNHIRNSFGFQSSRVKPPRTAFKSGKKPIHHLVPLKYHYTHPLAFQLSSLSWRSYQQVSRTSWFRYSGFIPADCRYCFQHSCEKRVSSLMTMEMSFISMSGPCHFLRKHQSYICKHW